MWRNYIYSAKQRHVASPSRCNLKFWNLIKLFNLEPAQGAIRKIFATCAYARICGAARAFGALAAPPPPPPNVKNQLFETKNNRICYPCNVFHHFLISKMNFLRPKMTAFATPVTFSTIFWSQKSTFGDHKWAVFATPVTFSTILWSQKSTFGDQKWPYLLPL